MVLRGNYKSFFVHSLLGALLVIGAACIFYTPKAAANRFPFDSGFSSKSDPDDHLAVSSIQGDWSPAHNPPPNGPFVGGTGKYNCQYPSLYPNGQDEHACTTGLNADDTYYEMYMGKPLGATPSTDLTLEGACPADANTPYNKPSQPSKGARQISVSIYRVTAAGGRSGGSLTTTYNTSPYNPSTGDGCQGTELHINVPGSAFTDAQAQLGGRYGPNTLTALVQVHKQTLSDDASRGGPGNETFRFRSSSVVSIFGAPGAYFAEVSRHQPATVGSPPVSDKDPTTYEFDFIPDCSFKDGSDLTIGLDALSPGSVQDIPIKLFFRAPGDPPQGAEVSQNTTGWTVHNLHQGVHYKLFVVNVRADNGIKFKLPFGQYAANSSDCQQEPGPGSVVASCSSTTVSDDGGYPKSGPPGTQLNKYPTRTVVTITGTDVVPNAGSFTTIVDNGVTDRKIPNDHDYIPAAPSISVETDRQFTRDGGKTWNSYHPWPQTQDILCYHAKCTSLTLDNGGIAPNNIIVAGQQFNAYAVIENDGPQSLPYNIHNHVFDLNYGDENASGNDFGNFSVHILGSGQRLDPGEKRTVLLTFTAPNEITSQKLVAHPAYSDAFHFGAGSACDATVNVYQPSRIEPKATLTYPSDENPTQIIYNGYVINHGGVQVYSPTQSSFTAGPGSCPQVGPLGKDGPFNPGAPPENYTIGPDAKCNPTSINAGDHYCVRVALTGGYNEVYIGPPGTLPVAKPYESGPLSAEDCLTVKNKPYFKVYNSAVSAGGSFSSAGGSCTGGGLLAGWNDNTGANRGASTQLSALALIKITGFASAQTVAGRSPTNLTFANTVFGDITSSSESPGLGGNFAPTGNHCLSDAVPPTKAGSETATVNGPYTLTATTIANGHNQSIFVNGDVRITGNITYDARPRTLDTIPSFVLHATGKIYIDPGVTELNGLYISKDKIYTCGNGTGFAPMPAANIYTGCNDQLTVYGSFVANQVNLMRAFGSLRNAVAGEQATSGARACSRNGAVSSQPICAAEVFRFSPELYLSQPATQLPNNGALRYDAITSLPPVL